MARTEHPITENPNAYRDCSGCGEPKARLASLWPRDEGSPDGLGYRCKACKSRDTIRSRQRKRAAAREDTSGQETPGG
jgi:hypothetical protein